MSEEFPSMRGVRTPTISRGTFTVVVLAVVVVSGLVVGDSVAAGVTGTMGGMGGGGGMVGGGVLKEGQGRFWKAMRTGMDLRSTGLATRH